MRRGIERSEEYVSRSAFPYAIATCVIPSELGPNGATVLFLIEMLDRLECWLHTMREVEVRLAMKLADAMGELRMWLDHNDCVPVSFDIKRQGRGVLVRVVFAENEQAEQFERRFAR